MPNDVLLQEWKDRAGLAWVNRVLKVKRIFKVSYKTVLFRLIQLGEAKNSLWADFKGKYHLQTGRTLGNAVEPSPLLQNDFRASESPIRRSQEPAQLSEADFVEDRFSRLVREAYLADHITLGRAAEMLHLPLPQMRARAAEWA